MKEKVLVNGENAVLGRLASYVAKQALLGKEIIVVNSEKVIVLGREKSIYEKFEKNKARGGSAMRGPYINSLPDRFLKRIIRGMLPYRTARGREALKRIKCYTSIPEKYKDKKMIVSGKGKAGITLQKISDKLRGRR